MFVLRVEKEQRRLCPSSSIWIINRYTKWADFPKDDFYSRINSSAVLGSQYNSNARRIWFRTTSNQIRFILQRLCFASSLLAGVVWGRENSQNLPPLRPSLYSQNLFFKTNAKALTLSLFSFLVSDYYFKGTTEGAIQMATENIS